jgi:hypothetical protein
MVPSCVHGRDPKGLVPCVRSPPTRLELEGPWLPTERRFSSIQSQCGVEGWAEVRIDAQLARSKNCGREVNRDERSGSMYVR